MRCNTLDDLRAQYRPGQYIYSFFGNRYDLDELRAACLSFGIPYVEHYSVYDTHDTHSGTQVLCGADDWTTLDGIALIRDCPGCGIYRENGDMCGQCLEY